MKVSQLAEIIHKLDPSKRIKFQNGDGWGSKAMAANAILEHGGVYILAWVCHPMFIHRELKEGQRLVWYNPRCHNADKVLEYFPDYKPLA